MAQLTIHSQDLEELRNLALPSILPQDKEDALADALETACHSFDPNRGDLKPFVHKIAYNNCIDHARKYRRQFRNVELDATPDVPDPKSEISEPSETTIPPWLEKTLKRCELLAMSPKRGQRLLAADAIVVLRRLKAMADADELDELHPKALYEGELHQAVVEAGHPISTKSMWDLLRFTREVVKKCL